MIDMETMERVINDNIDKIELSDMLAKGSVKLERMRIVDQEGVINNYLTAVLSKCVKTTRDYPLLSSMINVTYHMMHPIKSMRITRFWSDYVEEQYGRLLSGMGYPKNI